MRRKVDVGHVRPIIPYQVERVPLAFITSYEDFPWDDISKEAAILISGIPTIDILQSVEKTFFLHRITKGVSKVAAIQILLFQLFVRADQATRKEH